MGKPQGRGGTEPQGRGEAPRLLRFISAAPDSVRLVLQIVWGVVLQIVWGILSMLSRAIGTAGRWGYG